jgi:hypothetical protein
MIEQLEAEIAERRASKMVANVDLATAGAQELASAGVVPLRALLTTSWRPSRWDQVLGLAPYGVAD